MFVFIKTLDIASSFSSLERMEHLQNILYELKNEDLLKQEPSGHIAHLSNNSQNKISFMGQYTKYMDNEVELILYKKILQISFEYSYVIY